MDRVREPALNLNGGVINVQLLKFPANAPFNWTTGTLNLQQSVTFDTSIIGFTGDAFGPSLTLGAGQTLEEMVNETIGGTGVFATAFELRMWSGDHSRRVVIWIAFS